MASIGTCLHRWNERRLSDKEGTSHSPVPVPVTQYQDLSVDQEEIFGTRMIQNPNGLSDDNLEDGPDVIDPENDSTTDSSSEDGDYGTDDNDNERINNEDTYHKVLEYAMYMKSPAQDLLASYADALWARHVIFLPHERSWGRKIT